eukprot:758964-Pelagomonas_calceolata.AAC.3
MGMEFSCKLVSYFSETCCALGLHVCALSQPNSPPVCPNPPAVPPGLQVDPRMYPECPVDHLLRAGGGLFWEGLQSQPRGVLTIRNGFFIYKNLTLQQRQGDFVEPSGFSLAPSIVVRVAKVAADDPRRRPGQTAGTEMDYQGQA